MENLRERLQDLDTVQELEEQERGQPSWGWKEFDGDQELPGKGKEGMMIPLIFP